MGKQKGFTFIEIILYVVIVSIMMAALIPFAWDVIGGASKSGAQQEVFSQARFVSERIKYEIRNASGITSVGASSISLTNFSPDTTTVIDLSGGKIRINKNGAGAVNLNSDDTNVTNLTFTNYTSGDNKTKHIQFSFTIDDNYGSSRQEYDVPVQTIQGSAEVRSN
ncbi:type II secretion system protein [Candidatus Daviesbacteria bacterium]|nr:type II secretion system protein [Candidatus Daviesbacteria bacterium]